MPTLLYKTVVEKLTGEQWSEAFDFSGLITENTTVVSYTVTATKDDGTDVTGSMVVSDSKSSQTVTVVLNSLSAEASYTIKVAAVASDTTPATLVKLLNVSLPGVYR